MEGFKKRVKSPNEMIPRALYDIPDNVLKLWEEEVEKKWDGKQSIIYFYDGLDEKIKQETGLCSQELEKCNWGNNWINNMIQIFEQSGWKVTIERFGKYTFTAKK